MNNTTVKARLKSENDLKIGPDRETPNAMISLDGFTNTVNGEVLRFIYVDEQMKKKHLTIEGVRDFDLSKKDQKHNWEMLQIDLMLHPELKEQIELIDPNKIANDKIALAERKQALYAVVLGNKQNPEWLAKVYRRLVGPASGLTEKVLLNTILERLETDPSLFIDKQGKFFFESEYFETEALLDLACERGVIIKDGEYYKKQDGSVLANDRAKAVYELQIKPEYRFYVQQAVSAPVTDKAPEIGFMIENLADVDLLKSVGQKVDTVALNGDGSVDERSEDVKAQAELETIVEQLSEGGFVMLEGDTMLVESIPTAFSSKAELIGFLKGNPEKVLELKQLLTPVD